MSHWITDDLQEQAVNDIKTIVNIPSVCDEEHKKEGAPFGPEIERCLDATLDIFEKNGFSTYKDPDGYYGYAEVGEGDDIFAVLCHLDVVPAGDLKDWDTPPFEATFIDDKLKLAGRGVQDDKGPTIATLYALKAVVEQTGHTPNQRIRFIFGTDEETLWRCMDHYNEKEPMANMGFAPDADFPLIYAEKGLLQAKAVAPGVHGYTLRGGDALNVVPDKATYTGDKVDELSHELHRLGYDYQIIDDHTLQTTGRSVHSKDAADGVNAITHLAEAMVPYYDDPVVQFLGKCVKNDGRGFSVLGEVRDAASGDLSFNCATVSVTSEGSEIGLDLRVPVTIDNRQLVEKLTRVLKDYGLTYEQVDYVAPLYVPEDSELVETLLHVYRDVTGDLESQPIVSGGATFARTMKNCVAFGAMFPDSDTTEHQPNEAWNLIEMRRAMEIYAETFYRLVFPKP